MLVLSREFFRPLAEIRQRCTTLPVPVLGVSSGRQAQGRLQKAREVVAAWRFHLKRRRNLSSTPTIPFWSRTPSNERFSPSAHSNWMIRYCEEAVLVT